MDNEITEEFKRYIAKVYDNEPLDAEQYKQIWLAFHAGAVVWLKLMMKLSEEFKEDPGGGALKLMQMRKELFAACEDYTNQTKTVN